MMKLFRFHPKCNKNPFETYLIKESKCIFEFLLLENIILVDRSYLPFTIINLPVAILVSSTEYFVDFSLDLIICKVSIDFLIPIEKFLLGNLAVIVNIKGLKRFVKLITFVFG